MLPTWRNPDQAIAREAIYWHYPLEEPHFLGGRSASAIRSGDWKLIDYLDSPDIELFNLASDPGEKHDLASQEIETRERLLTKLVAWREALKKK